MQSWDLDHDCCDDGGADTGDSNPMMDDMGVEYVAGAFNRAMLQ